MALRKSGRAILDGIDLDVPPGRITVLMGPSGSGKTSVLRLLNRLDDPTSGTICYAGRLLSEYPVSELRRRVAFVFQTPTLFPGTVLQNLLTASRLGSVPDDQKDGRLREVTHLAQLDPGLLDRDVRELSVGQQKRAMIARALVSRPAVLLLDEPTASLDAETAARLLRTVRHLAHDRGLTVLISTHRLEEARAVGDSSVLLRDGRIIEVRPGGVDPATLPLPKQGEGARAEERGRKNERTGRRGAARDRC